MMKKITQKHKNKNVVLRLRVYEGLSKYVTAVSLGSYLVIAGTWDGKVSFEK
jgi:hypothetical protein